MSEYKFICEDLLSKYGFAQIPKTDNNKILKAMNTDKKSTDNGIYYILPDDYAGTAINTDHGAWNDNTISAEDWAAFEAAGAVFLPAAGFRDGTGVYNVGSNGFYWSSTPGDEYDAYYLYFDSDYLDPQYDYRRNYGRSVRLVR